MIYSIPSGVNSAYTRLGMASIPTEEFFLNELSGSREKGIIVPPARLPGKSRLSTVLLSSNPSEQRDLNRKLHKIAAEKLHRVKMIDLTQRHFLVKQIFDQDHNLRFLRQRKYTGDGNLEENKEWEGSKVAESAKEEEEELASDLEGDLGGGELEEVEEDVFEAPTVIEVQVRSTGTSRRPTRAPRAALPTLQRRAPVIFSAPNRSLGSIHLPHILEDTKTSHSLCSESIICRITQSLPMNLMIKANRSINSVIEGQKLRMLHRSREKTIQANAVDARFKNLESSLVAPTPEESDKCTEHYIRNSMMHRANSML